MNLIESKLNIVHWLTDYHGQVVNYNGRNFVELNHKSGFNKWVFSHQKIDVLLSQLDNFIERKLSTEIVNNCVNN